MAKFQTLRASEWLLIVYFAYVALIAPFFPDRPFLRLQPVFTLAAIALLLLLLSLAQRQPRLALVISYARDWLPILLAVVAFREMELFLPASYPRTYENSWIRQDHALLSTWHLRSAIESLGKLIPTYLELCYFLVYGLPEFCVSVLYLLLKRRAIDHFLFIYLAGTLLAYSLFPYFPSQPPRLAFPGADDPSYDTWLRQLNLYTLRNTTIHSAVFPSAHVSSAFAAVWAMLLLVPERKMIGFGLLIYALSVSVATIYGRYHYSADVYSGLSVSLIAGLLGLLLNFRNHTNSEAPLS